MTTLMTPNRRAALAAATLLASTALLAACSSSSDSGQPSASSAQNSSNRDAGTEYGKFTAAVPYPFKAGMPSDPLERKNLARRLIQQNSKGSTAYVYLFTYSGQVLGYYVINGKVSSTGSQMTSTQVNVDCGDHVTNGQSCTNDAIGDDGTFGPEEGGTNGVFFWTATGVLVETNQPWVSSTQPIPVYAHAPQLDAPAKQG